jgi:hypothetical protein
LASLKAIIRTHTKSKPYLLAIRSEPISCYTNSALIIASIREEENMFKLKLHYCIMGWHYLNTALKENNKY